MNILVTGGSGRIGGYALRELLAAGHDVSSFSRHRPLLEGVRFVKGDITNPDDVKEASKGHDAILHLAAILAPHLASPDQLMNINVTGTVNVLEAAVASGVEKVVFASSVATLGTAFARNEINIRYFPIDEAHQCEPQDRYGLSKVIGEITCKSYSDAYSIRTICLRIGSNWYLDREGANMVVRSGAGPISFKTVEELWNSYQDRRLDPEAGSPPGYRVFWDLLDARDTALACRLAIENKTIIHDVFFLMGNQTCQMIETTELASRFFPSVPIKTPLEGQAAFVSSQRASEHLGYKPRSDWKDSDFGIWLKEKGLPV